MKILSLLLAISMPLNSAVLEMPNELTLVGTGAFHYMGLVKLYDAELLASKNAKRENLLSPDVSRCLKLDYAVDLTKDKFILAADTVLQRQHDAATLEAVRPQVDQLHAAYQDVKSGDHYTLCYDSQQQQTTLRLNGKKLIEVPNPEFARIYFGIWLGEQEPISQTLRELLLQNLIK